MGNRLWGLFFGAPMGPTPSNFGLIADPPTHPELLDFLAAGLVSGQWSVVSGQSEPPIPNAEARMRNTDRGWSVKSLVREMVLSATYRQASTSRSPQGSITHTPTHPHTRTTPAGVRSGAAVDPENVLLWRQNRRRLTVEQWRDSALAVSGLLEPGGGPSRELTEPGNHRRTLYARISRLKLNDMLAQFDYPDANVHAEKRSVTTTPVQKLFMLNSSFMLEQAHALAARLTADPAESDAARVRRAYLLLYARAPTAEETQLAVEYLRKPEAEGLSRWDRYAQVLLASNEFLYVD